MEPRIQYAKTSDGVNIAYCEAGEGRPLVLMAGWPWTNLRAEWMVPTYRLYHETLSERCRLIRLDGRGSGLSDRNVDDISAAARGLDVDAVVERLDLREFDLLAWGPSGPAAVLYASQRPERVRRLILWDTAPQRTGIGEGAARFAAILGLMRSDRELFTETGASVYFGWSDGEAARQMAAFMRECVTPEMAVRAIEQTLIDDARALVPLLTTPTLVMVHRDTLAITVEDASELTALMQDASLAILDGTWITTDERARQVARTILDFVATEDVKRSEAEGTVTILFTDLSSSTPITQRLGDAKAQGLVRAHNAIVREALAASGGAEIKHTGDGIMASFSTASGALDCAIVIQRAVEASGDPRLRVHLGLNAGEPVQEEGDLFGTAVQLARRICDHAEGGEILASDVVRQLAAGKGFLFADRGDVIPKGFDEAVRLYEVRWRAEGA